MKIILATIFFFITPLVVLAQRESTMNSPLVYGSASANTSTRCFFIENKGQWSSEVMYLANLPGLNAWITSQGVIYDYYRLDSMNTSNLRGDASSISNRINSTEFTRHGQVIKFDLINGNDSIACEPALKQSTYYNYFIGNDSSRWASYVGLYEEILITSIYKGIDVRYYFDNGQLRYDYIVHPEGKVSQLQLKIEGANSVAIKDDNQLILGTQLGDVSHGALYTYQLVDGKKKTVQSKFVIENGVLQYDIGGYDIEKDLIIDPTLFYSTFVGGSNAEWIETAGVNSAGRVIVAGISLSSSFPTTIGAYDISANGEYDMFVSKLNYNGSALVYSTFIGGDSTDHATSMALDANSNVYLTGSTLSANYPNTFGAFDQTHNGFRDVVVTKLSSSGSALVYSTFIGGGSDDEGLGITIDAALNVYVTGYASDPAFPTTSGAYDQMYDGAGDSFVAKLNSAGSGLIYSTFLGGVSLDFGRAVAIDVSGNAYVAGVTASSGFPATPGAYDQSYNGQWDISVTKLNSFGSALMYSTFIGGMAQEEPSSIKLDASNNAYITGDAGGNFPVTSNSFDPTYNGSRDAVVAKLNATGTGLVFSTYVGGAGDDEGYSIDIELGGTILVTGMTRSLNFPVTSGSLDQSFNGIYDVFLTRFTSSGSSVLYSTYIGGSYVDYGTAVIADTGRIIVAGRSDGLGYPTTSGAYDPSNNGSADGFVTVFYDLISSISSTNSGCSNSCNGTATVSVISGVAPYTYTWSGGQTTAAVTNLCAGTYTVIITDAIGSTASQTVSITGQNVITNAQSIFICSGDSFLLPSGNLAVIAGTYIDTLSSVYGCDSIITTNLSVNPHIASSQFASICNGSNYTLPSGMIVNTAGVYVDTLTSATGCDSVITTNLSVNSQTNTLQSVSICSGSDFTLPSGSVVSAAGIYVDTLTNWTGCDSIITTNLIVYSQISSSQSILICNGSFFTLPSGNVVNTTGIYNDTLINIFGCDSIVTTNLTVAPSSVSSQSASICYGSSYMLPSGTVVNTSGTYTDTLISASGCDSVIITALAVNQPISTTQSSSICSGSFYTLPSGSSVNTAGTYTDTLLSVSGCDSIITTTLSVATFSSFVQSAWICEGSFFTLPSGITTSTSGVYSDTLTNVSGCDSIVTTNLSVNSSPTAVVSADQTIVLGVQVDLSASGGVSYYWSPSAEVSCATCNTTSATPVVNTTYCVVVADSNTCSDTACIDVTVLSECGELFVPNSFSPNGDGINDDFKIYFNPYCVTTFNIIIYDRWGERVFESNDQNFKWDGTYKGRQLDNAVFVYSMHMSVINSPEEFKINGDVSIVK